MLIRQLQDDIITEYQKSNIPVMKNILGALLYFISNSKDGLQIEKLTHAILYLQKVTIVNDDNIYCLAKPMTMNEYLKKSEVKLKNLNSEWDDSYLPSKFEYSTKPPISQVLSLPKTSILKDQAMFLMEAIKIISACLPIWSLINRDSLSNSIIPAFNIWDKMYSRPNTDPKMAHRDYINKRGCTVENNECKNEDDIEKKFTQVIRKSIKYYPLNSEYQLLDWLHMKAGQDLNRIIDIISMHGCLSKDNAPLLIHRSAGLVHNVFGTRNGVKIDIDMAINSMDLPNGDILYYDYNKNDFNITDIENYTTHKNKYPMAPDVLRLAVRFKLKIINNEVIPIIEELGIYSYTNLLVDPNDSYLTELTSSVKQKFNDLRLAFDPFKKALDKVHSISIKDLVTFKMDLAKISRENLLIANSEGRVSEYKLLSDSRIKYFIESSLGELELFKKDLKEDAEIPLELSKYLISRIDKKYFTAKLIYEIKYIQKQLAYFGFQSISNELKIILKSIKFCHYFSYNDKTKDMDNDIDNNKTAYFWTAKDINDIFEKRFPLGKLVVEDEINSENNLQLNKFYSLFYINKKNHVEDTIPSDRRLFKA